VALVVDVSVDKCDAIVIVQGLMGHIITANWYIVQARDEA
jgi:hypothetical protein